MDIAEDNDIHGAICPCCQTAIGIVSGASCCTCSALDLQKYMLSGPTESIGNIIVTVGENIATIDYQRAGGLHKDHHDLVADTLVAMSQDIDYDIETCPETYKMI